ncbi:DASH complex subunit Dad1-domain-containing protein [Tricharina praecox]|uniref:DASH complex subunit Dad1-domain-containing protein n=1 Tax=Tricharina praecox TaxID=43433 RepID=UPI002220C546|nr:DASH complex subunit Dad1-domain-containing protein [Tricharina praecox]KAI5845354.1 DASH complex subunit Dad1-domain-containing protein [Tricharina praecox]
MASSSPALTSAAVQGPTEKSFFEQQRDQLRGEIALAMEHVLMNMNTLNRNMESIIAVGREFESVEALWSQFEGVMGRNPGVSKQPEQPAEEEHREEAVDRDADVTMG